MEVTKKQHYIPQGLMKLFVGNDKKVFELLIERNKILSSEIENSMCQNYVYEHPDLDKNALEILFSKVESKYIPYIRKLVECINNSYNKTQTYQFAYLKNKILKLIPWFLFFYFRSGALLTEYASFSDKPKIIRVERMLDNILNISYIRKLTYTIKNCYQLSILISIKEEFIMSDQYISTVALSYKNNFISGSNRQIGLRDTLILVPLTSKYYLAFYQGNAPYYFLKNNFSTLTDEQVKEVNSVIYKNSYIKCIAQFSSSLEVVKNSINIRQGASKSLAFFDDNQVHSYITKKEVFFYPIDEDLSLHFIQYGNDYLTKIKGKVRRNDPCICGSGKKYKSCCMEKYEKSNRIWLDIKYKHYDYSILGALAVEKSIVDYYGSKDKMSDKDLKLLEDIQHVIKES